MYDTDSLKLTRLYLISEVQSKKIITRRDIYLVPVYICISPSMSHDVSSMDSFSSTATNWQVQVISLSIKKKTAQR